jgi:hypothetical protein
MMPRRCKNIKNETRQNNKAKEKNQNPWIPSQQKFKAKPKPKN